MTTTTSQEREREGEGGREREGESTNINSLLKFPCPFTLNSNNLNENDHDDEIGSIRSPFYSSKWAQLLNKAKSPRLGVTNINSTKMTAKNMLYMTHKGVASTKNS